MCFNVIATVTHWQQAFSWRQFVYLVLMHMEAFSFHSLATSSVNIGFVLKKESRLRRRERERTRAKKEKKKTWKSTAWKRRNNLIELVLVNFEVTDKNHDFQSWSWHKSTLTYLIWCAMHVMMAKKCTRLACFKL